MDEVVHAGSALIDPAVVFKHFTLAPGMRVADFGCGRTGHFIFQMSRQIGEQGVVYAVDIMKDILASIDSRVRSEGYDNIRTLWSDIERVGYTPIPESSLDAVMLVNILSQVQDAESVVGEAKRFLAPRGKLIVIDWARPLGPLGPAPEKMLNSDRVRALATPGAFSVLDEFAPGEYHFGVILERR